MTTKARWALKSICLIAAFAQAAATAQTKQETANIVCKVDATVELRRIPRTLYGTNVEWFNNGNGIVDDSGNLRSDLVNAAKEEGISLYRFPGGTFSDYYHWRDGTGPIAKRPTTEHFTDPGKSKNVMGSPGIARFAQVTGGELLITVNAGTGTPEEAASWVEYFNGSTNAQRKLDGFEKPLGIHYWEVGNELYLPGNPGTLKVGVTPEVYAQRFAQFAHAMKSADPDIALIAIASSNATRLALPYPDWLRTILKSDASDIDLVAVHDAYFPILFENKNYDYGEVYSALWAAPESIDRDLARIEDTIGKYGAGRDIGIAVTEWGPLFAFNMNPQWLDQVKTMGSAVFVGRVLQVFISHPKVRIANYFKFTDGTPMGWVAYNGVPKAPYYALQLFSRHFGTRLIRSEITGSQTYDTPAIGAMPAEQNVPEVTAVASLDEKGDKLFVNLINRSRTRPRSVTLAIKGFRANKGMAEAWSLASGAVTDSNGPDLSTELLRQLRITEPLAASSRPITLQKTLLDPARPIELAPFSLLTLEISRNN
jgi:alpha-L-arabinofuranosidase